MNRRTSRRQFLATSAAVTATGIVAPLNAHVSGGDTLKVGLIGCGRRGTGAAANALQTGPAVKLHAMADVFADRIADGLDELKKDLAAKLDVAPDRRFTGFDSYKGAIDTCDVVLLCSPPHFRPAHLRYAVEQGKHIFCEKPMAVDGPGVRSVLETAALAKRKGICIRSGFCFRFEPAKRETIQRIHDGAIGDIVAIQASYNTGGLWHIDRQPDMSDLEWQVRNWLYFTWLSGDHIVEQHIHNLDKAAWALKDTYPIAATGMGGRQVRADPKFGHIFDHHAVVFEYSAGTKVFSFCRQIDGCEPDVSDHLMGTKGTCQLMRHQITGETKWRYAGPKANMYQVEHDELFVAIRAGKPVNDGDWMAKSTLMGIMGRMATYTGKRVTWDQALNSRVRLGPAEYSFGTKLDMPPVAMPGKTPLI